MGFAQFQNTKLAGLGSQVHSRGLLFPLRSGEHEISSISWFQWIQPLLMELSVAKPSFHDFLMSMGFAQFQNTKLAGLGSQVHSCGLLFPLRSGEQEISSISWFRGFSSC